MRLLGNLVKWEVSLRGKKRKKKKKALLFNLCAKLPLVSMEIYCTWSEGMLF